MEHPPALTIPRLVRASAQRHGSHPAVVEGEKITTYTELGALVELAARAFIASGVEHGDRVGVWAPNSLEYIVALLGAQGAGASVVPLNTRYRGHEAKVILQRARVKALVLSNGFLGKDYAAMLGDSAQEDAAGDGGPVPGIPSLTTMIDLAATSTSADGTLAWSDFLARAESVSPETARAVADAISADDVCDILFTSGTTGVPKGVMSAHRQTIGAATVWARGAELSPADRYAIVNPFFHSFGYKAGFIACIVAGTTVYPVVTLDVDALLSLISHEAISVLPGVPTIFTSILEHPSRSSYDLSSLRFSIAGAASVPETLYHRMIDELGFESVAQAYGLTECVVATRSRPKEDPSHIAETTGPAVPGIEVRIVNGQGEQVPTGIDGEILLRGDNVMLGYFEDEAATRAAIDADGWLHTGDVGRLDDHGCLKITDRINDMFTVGGFNVYPAEIENVLSAHPSVSESAVIAVDDERLGSVGCAYVVPRHGAGPTAEELIAFCRERLANFKVPRQVIIVHDFPRNATGKILKTTLRAER